MAANRALALSSTLAAPIELATEAIAILGRRGSGKTNTAVVLVEELIGAGVQTVVVDTVGVWWGLRSSADGSHAGIDVVVFGGEHADVPLEETAGHVIADAVIDFALNAVIDTSGLRKAEARRFLLNFVTRLYERKARDRRPIHVVFDESDELAPQRTDTRNGNAGPALLSAMEDFVRRGRARGLGCTLVTQRPAVLNKDVLTQVEVLIAMQMTGPTDRSAIDAWTSQHADDDQAREVKNTLASLTTGTGWVWSPTLLTNPLQKTKFRARRTFDSSATPKVGERRLEPTVRAEVDLTKLGEQIQATIEKAKADDPKALRAELARIARELDAARTQVPEPTRVEVPVLTKDDIDVLDRASDSIDRALEPLAEMRAAVGAQLLEIEGVLLGLGARFGIEVGGQATAPQNVGKVYRTAVETVPDRKSLSLPGDADGSRAREVHEANRKAARSPLIPIGTEKPLGKAERTVLTVLAQRGAQSDRQIATLGGYSHKGGGFRNALGALRSAGHIVGSGGRIDVTEAGLAALGDFEPLPTGRALIDHWTSHPQIGKAERLILLALIDAYPGGMTPEEVAAATEYAPTGGGFRNALGKLRSLELIYGGRGEPLTVNDELGEAGR